MIAPYLRRGMAAGLLAGLLAGLFAFFIGEPSVDQAIQIEEVNAAEQHEMNGGGQEEEVFSRSTQKIGLFFATGLSGAFVGGLFGLAFAYLRGRLASGSDWTRSLSLAAAIFVGAALIPTRLPSETAPLRIWRWSRSRCSWSWPRGTRPVCSGRVGPAPRPASWWWGWGSPWSWGCCSWSSRLPRTPGIFPPGCYGTSGSPLWVHSSSCGQAWGCSSGFSASVRTAANPSGAKPFTVRACSCRTADERS
jgi:hypothetical protein